MLYVYLYVSVYDVYVHIDVCTYTHILLSLQLLMSPTVTTAQKKNHTLMLFVSHYFTELQGGIDHLGSMGHLSCGLE